jgi:tyrosyl-tRNA synthetase
VADATTARLAAGDLAPVEAKRLLARTVVDLYHGEGSGAAAEAEFDRVFKAGDQPSEIAEIRIPDTEFVDGRIRLARVLALAFPDAVPSNKEGVRKIQQGGVRLDGKKIENGEATFTGDELAGQTLQLGKRNWAVITP